MPCWLFHNNGDGTFTDVSKESGIGGSPAKGWGVDAADINNDGWIDLFVGNDTVANFLFANRGKGRFEEIGSLGGVGYNSFGLARSGMGVDAADYDQDGWLDLFVANVDHGSFALFHNNKDESFTDVAIQTGMDALTSRLSGWGLKFFDYDNDGNLDLLLCNGHPDTMVEKRMEDVNYREPMILIRNSGSGFKNVRVESGSVFSRNLAARGMALGDFFFFSSRRRHTRLQGDWSSDVCSSDLEIPETGARSRPRPPAFFARLQEHSAYRPERGTAGRCVQPRLWADKHEPGRFASEDRKSVV